MRVLAIVYLALPLTLALTTLERSKFSSKVTISESGSNYVLSSNSIPDHATGDFPSRGNPNSISSQSFSLTVPKSPAVASTESCMPMGPVGMATNGVGIYNVYTVQDTDAVVNEVFDDCDGHPDGNGFYHYHQVPDCVYQGGNNELLGVAMDGFPIYGPKDENGNELSSADLDKCHGRTYNGQYQYHMTRDFPYTVGCFKGEVTLNSRQQNNCKFAISDSSSNSNNNDNNNDNNSNNNGNQVDLSMTLFPSALVFVLMK